MLKEAINLAENYIGYKMDNCEDVEIIESEIEESAEQGCMVLVTANLWWRREEGEEKGEPDRATFQVPIYLDDGKLRVNILNFDRVD